MFLETNQQFMGTEIKVPLEKRPENYKIMLKRGLKLYKVNMETGVVDRVNPTQSAVEFQGKKKDPMFIDATEWVSVSHRVENGNKVLFFQSLNDKNANKKAQKFLQRHEGARS